MTEVLQENATQEKPVADPVREPAKSETQPIIVANAFSLVQMAIEKNWDSTRITQILDLRDRVENERKELAYVEAMGRAQAKIPIVIRDKDNKTTGSKYARLESVNNLAKPIYTQEGFTLEFGEGISPLPNHRRIECEVQHIQGFKKIRFLDSPIDDRGPQGAANKTAIQGLVSTVTYLRRCLTCMIFNITIADTDNDGNDDELLLNEEQIECIAQKIRDCRDIGHKINEVLLIDWLAKQQRQPAKEWKEIQQKVFARAISTIDNEMRNALSKVGSAGKVGSL